jgi:hypothetical protein
MRRRLYRTEYAYFDGTLLDRFEAPEKNRELSLDRPSVELASAGAGLLGATTSAVFPYTTGP